MSMESDLENQAKHAEDEVRRLEAAKKAEQESARKSHEAAQAAKKAEQQVAHAKQAQSGSSTGFFG